MMADQTLDGNVLFIRTNYHVINKAHNLKNIHVHNTILFIACMAIPMIVFPRVRCMFIYIFACITYTCT